MAGDLTVTFTGIRFENPFLLASAPPTESESNILKAFEAAIDDEPLPKIDQTYLERETGVVHVDG